MDVRNIDKIELLYNSKVIGKYAVDNAYKVIDRTEFDNELLNGLWRRKCHKINVNIITKEKEHSY